MRIMFARMLAAIAGAALTAAGDAHAYLFRRALPSSEMIGKAVVSKIGNSESRYHADGRYEFVHNGRVVTSARWQVNWSDQLCIVYPSGAVLHWCHKLVERDGALLMESTSTRASTVSPVRALRPLR
jgi:hypothetical protein